MNKQSDVEVAVAQHKETASGTQSRAKESRVQTFVRIMKSHPADERDRAIEFWRSTASEVPKQPG
jgi:hypothetical protein